MSSCLERGWQVHCQVTVTVKAVRREETLMEAVMMVVVMMAMISVMMVTMVAMSSGCIRRLLALCGHAYAPWVLPGGHVWFQSLLVCLLRQKRHWQYSPSSCH